MITKEQIPNDALIAFLREMQSTESTSAALAAAINAWPGMRDSQHVSFDGRVENAIVLPLPAQSANA